MSPINEFEDGDIVGDAIQIEGGTDSTRIGNIGDSLKVVPNDQVFSQYSIGVAQTTLSSSAILLNTPEGCNKIKIKHITTGQIAYIGNNRSITSSSTDVYPLKADEILDLNIDKNQNNEIYLVSNGTSIIVYAIGGLNE
jgi:hypothetical protein